MLFIKKNSKIEKHQRGKYMYIFMEDPYLVLGQKMYHLYEQSKREQIPFARESLISSSLIQRIMANPKQLGYQTFDDVLKMLISSYHINCYNRYNQTSPATWYHLLEKQYQEWEGDHSFIDSLEDFCDHDFLDQLRKNIMILLIDLNSLENFKERLFTPLLKRYFGKFHSKIDEFMEKDYLVIEELVEEFLRNYRFYQMNNILPLTSELGWSIYEMYQKDFGDSILKQYQVPYRLKELQENLKKKILENSNDESTFSCFLVSYRDFKRRYQEIKMTNYFHYLIEYLKVKNPEGYKTLKHLLLKNEYILLAIQGKKTREEYTLMNKLAIHQLSDKEFEGNYYFLKDFYNVLDSPSLQMAVLQEKEKTYVKKFDKRK